MSSHDQLGLSRLHHFDHFSRCAFQRSRALVADLVLAKFDVIADDLKQRIDCASNDELKEWSRCLLTATSLDDVFI